MISFRMLTYKPMVEIIRRRGLSSKTKTKEWKKPNYSHFPNPGIQRRLGIAEHEEVVETEPSDVDDTDFNFMEVNKMHHLHETEEAEVKHMTQLKIVGRKYFRPEKGLNLLTWSEKEQIRYLHNSDQDTWTVEKLANSFPASKVTIMKILKSKWHPRDASRVLKHDLAVQKSWELLQNRKLDVDPELEVHLSQFTQRTVPASYRPDLAEMFEGADSVPEPKQSEFGSIIASYKSLKCKDMPESDTGGPPVLQRACDTSAAPKSDSFLLQRGKSYSQHGCVTLAKYRERVLKAIKKDHDTSMDVKLMVSRCDNHEDVPETIQEASSGIASTADRDCTVGLNSTLTETSPDLNADPPERIRIPANKWQKGCTFKVGDCYYDDDGTFLYRVPGMK